MGSFRNRTGPWLSTFVALLSLTWAPLTGSQATAAAVPSAQVTSPVAEQGTLLSHNNSSSTRQVTVALQWNDADQLDALLADLYNPHSSKFKQFLTLEQFAAQFGPTTSTVHEVEQFLQSKGLQIVSLSPNRAFLKVSGTAKQVEDVFGTSFDSQKLPAAMHGVIQNVIGLDSQAHFASADWQVKSQAKTTPAPAVLTANVTAPAGGFTPADLRSAYDINPLLNSGIDGTGQAVALMELDGYRESNVMQFDNYYGLGSPAPANIYIDGYNGAAGQAETLVESDIEWVNAIAPQAQVYVYEAPNTDQGLIDAYQRIATDDLAKSIVTNWGGCEQDMVGSTTMNSLHAIFQQYAAQGQSVFTGNSADGCYPTGRAVASPADDPYVTGVAGTTLTVGTTRSESAWSSSGGGLSAVYSAPDYQINAGVAQAGGMRSVPDVAMAANGNSVYTMGSWTELSGTSNGVPVWAAIAALANEYAANNNKAPLGQANLTFYNLYATTPTYPAFHDIVSGGATRGYDIMTGIGSPDVYNLVRDLN